MDYNYNKLEIKFIFNDIIKDLYIPESFSFECQNCGLCCRGEEGLVILFKNDLRKILKNLKISEDFFKKNYTKNYFTFLSLKEKPNYDCIFWDENYNFKGCKIYRFKPYQCDSFPFWVSVFLSKNSFINYNKKCKGFFKGEKIFSRKDIIKKIYKDFEKRFLWYKYLYDFEIS
ncbi:MAG: YkgJ family cysteine cluster protein [Spirochaetes bacterium]|nr:YkgJ family cysteine cluster protein [Spirochaetota bacterium]